MNEKINATDFDNGASSHLHAAIKLEHLNIIKNKFREDRNFIFLAGDSSLDNKHWFINNPDKGNPLNGYEEIIEGNMTKDVSYQINSSLNSDEILKKYICINTAVEATTLESRKNSLQHHSDIFIKDNIQPNDILIISVGGNDVAFTIG